MDATVDDFFNEINEIAPRSTPKPPAKRRESSSNSVWQECHDELTGYSYYWNTKTDEVTWTTPAEYKSVKEQKKEKGFPKKNLFVPPRAAPLFPSTSTKVSDDSVKIYSIGNSSKTSPKLKNVPTKSHLERRKSRKRPYDKNSDSEDEKIELISSFGDESDSEDEPDSKKLNQRVGSKKLIDNNVSDDDDELDLLTKIQKRAKELKELGGDIPPEVSNIVNQPETEIIKAVNTIKEKKKSIAGFSLVAGYSDSDEEQENEEIKSLFPVAPEVPKISHSRLFPITKPIDVKEFMQPTTIIENKPASPSNEFDTKVFQRKRRIGIALINTGKKKEEISNDQESERKGFGFSTQESNPKDNVYAGFKKGGVMFVKSDVLNPTLSKDEEINRTNDDNRTEEKNSNIKREDIEDMYFTIKEKLGFLSEGRPSVSPVQIMVIQAETLFMAMKDGGLRLPYLQKWLNETCSDLIKLEKEAAPEGWLLQWDRSNKRYYYQNQATGESQWEYPQPDISRCDEAMDISTTPPPIEPTIHMSPPLPPTIRSPTPPPPPIISVECDSNTNEDTVPDVSLPPEPPAPTKFVDNGEPLPPGVDLPEIVSYNKPKEKEPKPADPLYSALDSFYSDIAAIENTNSSSPPPLPLPQPVEETKIVMEIPTETAKKKKKAKVKLAPGLSMKKKGVSQLVEKWKSVQQHYND